LRQQRHARFDISSWSFGFVSGFVLRIVRLRRLNGACLARSPLVFQIAARVRAPGSCQIVYPLDGCCCRVRPLRFKTPAREKPDRAIGAFLACANPPSPINAEDLLAGGTD
jgi:hypothetical protein